jgi:hypothetical protein
MHRPGRIMNVVGSWQEKKKKIMNKDDHSLERKDRKRMRDAKSRSQIVRVKKSVTTTLECRFAPQIVCIVIVGLCRRVTTKNMYVADV